MKGNQKVSSLNDLVALFGKIKKYEWNQPLKISWELWSEARKLDQNALSHVWYREAAKQLEDRHEWEVAGECKLDYAVPILLAECEEFRDIYSYCLENYTREVQIEILGKGMVKCTRLLNKKQFTEYLSGVQNFYGKNGIHLIAQGEYEDIMMGGLY